MKEPPPFPIPLIDGRLPPPRHRHVIKTRKPNEAHLEVVVEPMGIVHASFGNHNEYHKSNKRYCLPVLCTIYGEIYIVKSNRNTLSTNKSKFAAASFAWTFSWTRYHQKC